MHIVLVSIYVKPQFQTEFIQATLQNARHSIEESGIQRFDFIQDVENRDHFILIEAYTSQDDQVRHRNTTHYNVWKETVADMMSEPRMGTKYVELYPPEEEWYKREV